MVVKSNFKQKIIFVTVFLEIRYLFLKNLKLALGIERATRNIWLFYRKSKTRNKENY